MRTRAPAHMHTQTYRQTNRQTQTCARVYTLQTILNPILQSDPTGFEPLFPTICPKTRSNISYTGLYIVIIHSKPTFSIGLTR